MSHDIEYKSHKTTRNRDGVVSTIQYLCPWADIAKTRPRMGEAHPSELGLYCVEVEESGEGKPTGNHTYEYCRITARYSTYQRVADSEPRISLEFGGEMLETGLGRRWHSTGTVCDQAQAVFYPNMIINYSIVLEAIPTAVLINCVGKVNYGTFMGYAHETLLFEGASADSQWDYERGMYFYRMGYRFQFRPNGHNMVWRAPRQARDVLGNLADSGAPNYDPIFVDGPAGIGGWDRPVPGLYERVDFNPLFGWPAKPVYIAQEAQAGRAPV